MDGGSCIWTYNFKGIVYDILLFKLGGSDSSTQSFQSLNRWKYWFHLPGKLKHGGAGLAGLGSLEAGGA